ncbi:MAG: hypothetical protein GX295_06680 [Syntrophomonadaceae bacterium]|nr:hypothetical protein [Syntrophomonadaceae bacterium]
MSTIGNRKIIGWLVLALILGILVSPWASSNPDGLERVAEDQAFIDRAENLFAGLIPDYLMPGIENEAVATALAGGIGVLITLGFTILIGNLVSRKTIG